MGGIILVIIVFLIGLYVQHTDGMIATFWVVGLALVSWWMYKRILGWLKDKENSNAAATVKQAAAAVEKDEHKQQPLLKEWEATGYIIPDQIRSEVERHYRAKSPKILYPLHLNSILTAQHEIYTTAHFDKTTLSVQQAKAIAQIFIDAFVQGLLAYTAKVDPRLLYTESNETGLAVIVNHSDLYGQWVEGKQWLKYQLAPGHYDAIKALAEPFRTHRQRLEVVFPFGKYGPEYGKSPDSDNYDDKATYRAAEKRYEQGIVDVNDIYNDYDFAGMDTPYWKHGLATLPLDVHREPFDIPNVSRFAGMWIVAPPGRGKTNLLHNLIAEDRTRGTVVLMDSKGDLINAYRGLPDVVVIEPRTANINPLQLGSSTRSVEFLEYIFSALLETGMTSLQKTLFRSVLTVLLQVPDATLETFRQVLTVGWKPLNLEEYIRQCDPATQDFFLEGKKPEFDSNTYSETKQQILWRLRLILSNEYLRAIFTSPTTNVPFNELLDSRKLILIDNSKDDLGEEGAEFFGRFFVALVWMAAVSRSRLRPEDKVPVYFYIDECHTVIKRDTKVTTILDECRSQKIALTLAHQRIAQINPEVIDALNNCGIRMANSDDDAESLAKRFRVEAAALRLPVGKFACFVRDKTSQAATIDVPSFDTSQFPPPPPQAPHDASQTPDPKPSPRTVPNDKVEDF